MKNISYAVIIADYGKRDNVTKMIREARKHNIETIYVYDKKNKCVEYENLVSENMSCFTLDNIGREQETYLQFIVNNYNQLEDVLIFALSTIYKTDPFSGDRWSRYLYLLENKEKHDIFCTHPGQKIENEFNFRLKSWENIKQNPAPSNFDKWYLEHVGTSFTSKKDSVCYNGIFKTTREKIHTRPLKYYKNLLQQFETTNDEIGHYMERADQTIFGHT